MAHLEAFVMAQFSDTFGVAVENFEGKITTYATFPDVVIMYTVEVTFADTSSFTPSTDELDVLVQLAFLEPPVFDLLTDFQNLPSDNPFSGTESVEYSLLEERIRVDATPRSTLSNTQITLVTGVSAMILVIAVFLLMRCRTRRIEARFSTATSSKVQDIPILMPAHSYGYSIVSSHSENIMQFRDDTGSTASSGSIFSSTSIRSIPSQTTRLYAHPVRPSKAFAETRIFPRERAEKAESNNSNYSGELDIRPV